MSTGDEHFYELVANELETENLDKGAWTKALAMNDFDKERARADYVQIRVSQLKVAHEPDLWDRLRAFKRGYRKGVEEFRRDEERSRKDEI